MNKTIDEICTVVRGSSPRPQGDPRYYGGNIPRLMVADVSRDGMYVTPRIDSLTKEGALKSRPMKKGELIIAVSGDPGEPCILAIDACIHDGFVGLKDMNEEIVFIPYLYQYLKLIKIKNKEKAVGAIYKNLNTDQIKSFQIPLPPLTTQKRIAAILDAADEYRQKTKTLIEKYDQLAQSLFLEMFGDPIINNKNWNVKELKSLSVKILSGNTPKGGSNVYVSDGITFFRSQNVWRNKIVLDDIAYIDQKTHNKMSNSSLKNGDILMTKTGRFNTENSSLGRAAMYLGKDDNANINGHVYLVRLKENIIKEFVLFIITTDSYRDYIRSICVGGIDKRQINKSHLEEFPIIYPPIELQKKFAEQVQLIEQQKQQAQASLQRAEELFSSLLQRAFSGELVQE